jgi:membrane dipeptidase
LYIDGHNDTLKKIYLSQGSIWNEDSSDLHWNSCISGGYRAGFFAIMTIAQSLKHLKVGYGLTVSDTGWEVRYPEPVPQPYAENFTKDVLNYFLDDIKDNHTIKIVKNIDELTDNQAIENVLSVILHLEGAEAIRRDLSNLCHFYELGLRSLGIVWSRANAFGQGVPFQYPGYPDVGEGLTEAGRALIKRCNELGILVDLAHINQKGFEDVAKISNKPLVVTHTAAHAICPSSTNITDEQMIAIKKSNGVVGVLFDVLNTRADGKYDLDTSADQVAEHIMYMADVMEIDHIAIGSDYDGAVIPHALKEPSSVQKIFNILVNSGYSQEDVEKIAYKNWMRVLSDTWRVG